MSTWNNKWVGLGLLASLASFGCTDDEMPNLNKDFGTSQQALTAYCSIKVGNKTVQMETDYIPHVIACENGNAPYEALKVQAVAARTYAYRHLLNGNSSICDSQSCQVYTCSNKPSQRHYQAALDTQGVILSHGSNVLTSFFVAGAIPSNKTTCKYTSGDKDPTKTQKYVTYNYGKTGSAVSGSTLGYLSNPTNRGCMSQNGSSCLDSAGWKYREILKFFYGDDVSMEQATGACISPVDENGKDENEVQEEDDTGTETKVCSPKTASNPSSIFKDIPADNWGVSYANALYNAGIAKGCQSDPLYFCYDCELSREQAVTFLFRALKLTEKTPNTPSFSDVPKGYEHAGSTYGQIEAAADYGIISGCAVGKFCPENKLTRAEAATLFVRALKLDTAEYASKSQITFSDVDSTAWYYPYVMSAAAICLMVGSDGKARPTDPITRIEFAKLLAVAFKYSEGLCIDDAVECSDTKPCKSGTCNEMHVCVECTSNKCSGTQTLKVCADGKFTSQTCEYGCYNGKCGLCTNGSKTCEDNQPMICSDGEFQTNGSACSKKCLSGTCIECETNNDCTGNATCQSGSCISPTPICTPGTASCDGNNIKTCNTEGTGYTTTLCNGTCTGNGICQPLQPQDCTPNDLRCNGKILESCTAQGTWQTNTACPVLCITNTCAECTDNSKKCSDSGKIMECNGGKYVETSACATGQKCDAGSCVDDTAPTTCTDNEQRCNGNNLEICSNNTWSFSKTCDTLCSIDKCIECVGSASTCDNSNNVLTCVDGLYQSTPCSNDQSCINGVCVPKDDSKSCTKDADCAPSEICMTGKCIANTTNNDEAECTSNSDCENGKICMDEMCVESTGCTSDSECKDGEICNSGICVTDESAQDTCKLNSDCEEDEICQNKVCVKDTSGASCSKDKDCSDGEVCQNKVCVKDTSSDSCKKDKDCSDGEVCQNKVCVKDTSVASCDDDEDCGDDQVCYNDICTIKCKKNKDCASDEICDSKEKVCVITCSDNKDCGSNRVCVDGTCMGQKIGVYSDSNCSQNNTKRGTQGGFLALMLLPLLGLLRRRKEN